MLTLPPHGQDPKNVLKNMQAMRANDARWQDGKTFSLVFDPGEEARQLLKDAYCLFFSENALNPSAFPSLRRMEHETVAMTAGLLNGNDQVAGNITSGGTESILMALKTARDYARDQRGITEPNIVLPITSHPAHDKAGAYFNIEIRHAPTQTDYTADVDAMAALIDDNTILIGGSAVQYAQGVVDPIQDIAALAQEHDLLCHVDACIGGFMLPFVEKLGYPVPLWDFRVPGVTSISCDLHKYAYASKGASAILYRDAALRRYQFHAYMDWPGGIYASPTMAGTRPGGALAAAWAIMQHLGEAGYLAIAKDVMHSTQQIADGIAAIDGIQVLGTPHMSIIGIGASHSGLTGLDIYHVGDELQARGWMADRQQHPNSLHLTISRGHHGREQAFLTALAEAVEAAQNQPIKHATTQASLAIANGLTRLLPSRVFGAVSRTANKLSGGDGVPKRSAALYGMLSSLPARGELQELVLDALDSLHSLPKNHTATQTKDKTSES